MPDGFKLETAVILNEFDFEKGREKLYEVHVSTIFTKPCQILDLKWLTKLCKVPV